MLPSTSPSVCWDGLLVAHLHHWTEYRKILEIDISHTYPFAGLLNNIYTLERLRNNVKIQSGVWPKQVKTKNAIVYSCGKLWSCNTYIFSGVQLQVWQKMKLLLTNTVSVATHFLIIQINGLFKLSWKIKEKIKLLQKIGMDLGFIKFKYFNLFYFYLSISILRHFTTFISILNS